jgi:hypothetical protein
MWFLRKYILTAMQYSRRMTACAKILLPSREINIYLLFSKDFRRV